LTSDGLCEVARYRLGKNNMQIMGATYVEDVFYAVTSCYDEGTYVIAFDLTTNEEIDSIKTVDWGKN
jgi:hypothetical protein